MAAAKARAGERITVAVRIKPESKYASEDEDESDSDGDAAAYGGSVGRRLLARAGAFADSCFGPAATQRQLHTSCGEPLVDALFEGYDGCLVAYGQTGSGKTHTMLGADGGKRAQDMHGIIPQAVSDIFRRLRRHEADAAALAGGANVSQYQVRATYVEVYREKAYDLLAKAGRSVLEVAQRGADGAGRIDATAVGAREEEVKSTRALMRLIEEGAARRTTAATGQNEHSSRSHALLTLSLEQRWRAAAGPAASTGSSRGGSGDAAGGAGKSKPAAGRSRFARKARSEDDDGTDAAAAYCSRTSRLVLVDLAGSESTSEAHDGDVDAAGVAINNSLLVLGQVCAALAAGADHVPYRSSLLTRLLQRSLGGRCRTRLIACLNGTRVREAESLRTLAFAERVAGLKTGRGKAAIVDVEAPDDPMRSDMDDPVKGLGRRARWIETAEHGDVFARVLGDSNDPLILYIHGSGPRTSSLQWNELVLQLGLRSRWPFYHVAIDCPGYGRSPGDKQTVRSYPGALVRDLVRSLGKTKAYCVVGSSQGACATFNAVLEVPTVTHFVAVKDPVGHDVSRYTRIAQPALLVFDEEDDGHPISVGRRMRKNLPRPHWHEYRASEQPEWETRNLANAFLAMLREEAGPTRAGGCGAPRPDTDAARANSEALPDLTRVAGGLRAWCRAHDREHKSWEVDPDADPAVYDVPDTASSRSRAGGAGGVGGPPPSPPAMARSKSSAERAAEAAPIWDDGESKHSGRPSPRRRADTREAMLDDGGAYEGLPGESKRDPARSAPAPDPEWRAVLKTSTAGCRVVYTNSRTGETRKTRPLGVDIAMPAGERRVGATADAVDPAAPLFDSAEHAARVASAEAAEAEAARARELEQRSCDLCAEPLLAEPGPVRLPKCRHLVCACCCEAALRYFRHCPVCFAVISGPDTKVVDAEVQAALGAEDGGAGSVDADSRLAAQMRRYARLRRERDSARRLVIEIGNTATVASDASGRSAQKTFVRVVPAPAAGLGARKGPAAVGPSALKSVDFNINPRYTKPTARVTSPEVGVGYALERSLAFEFPCFATLHFDKALGVPPVLIRYKTQMTKPRHALRIVIEMPPAAASGAGSEVRSGAAGARRRGDAVTYDAVHGEGWVRFGPAGAASIDYNNPRHGSD